MAHYQNEGLVKEMAARNGAASFSHASFFVLLRWRRNF